MAEGKKSFQLYTEWIEIFEELEDEDAGQLIKHIFNYVNDKNPQTDNKIVKISFIQMRQQLKRDLLKWREMVERNRLNGSKGGRPITDTNPQEPTGLNGKPKKPDKDKVEDKVKEEANKINNIPFEIFIKSCFDYLGMQYVKGNPGTHGIENPIRKWLLLHDPVQQNKNLKAYLVFNTDKKFRAKGIDSLLEKLEGYNFTQDLKQSATVINGQPKKTNEEIEKNRLEQIEMQKAYARMRENVGK